MKAMRFFGLCQNLKLSNSDLENMKKQDETKAKLDSLPACAAEFIKLVIKKMRYRKKVRQDVQAELAAHFEDELKNCKSDDDREQKAQKLTEQFGDAKLLAVLLRRAKKRCRPLWQKYLIHSFQVIGFVVLYIVVRVMFLTIGTANISVNYIDWLNKLVAANKTEAENAKVYYDRAAELSLKIPPEIEKKAAVCTSEGCSINNNWFADFNDSEIERFVKWLTDSQTAFEALRQGSQSPYYWPVYENIESGPIQNTLLQDVMKLLPKYRRLARAMGWQIIYDTYRGRVSDALNNCLVLQTFGRHLQRKGLLIEQMVGIAIEAVAHQRTFMLLEKQDIQVDMLRDFHTKLENNLSNTGPIMDWHAEKVFWYDLVQRGFTDDGNGNGRVLKNGLPLAIKDARSSLAGFFFWSYPDRREVVATIDRYFEESSDLLEKTPYELHLKGESHLWDELGKECFMLQMLGPAHGSLSELSWRLKTARSGLLTVVAVLLYQKEKGGCPIDLNKLVSNGYLKNLPMDPYSDRPLIYRKTDEGFTLYSVGPNFEDDGGQFAKGKKGKLRLWADEGDAVFWPVRKPNLP